jgi:hypothetical protein
MYEVPSRSKRDDEFSGDGFAQRLFALAVRLQVCESASPTWTRCGILTLVILHGSAKHGQRLVPLLCLSQQLDLGITLNPLRVRLIPQPLVSLRAVRLRHLFYTKLVLFFYLQLELELVEHASNFGAGERRIVP